MTATDNAATQENVDNVLQEIDQYYGGMISAEEKKMKDSEIGYQNDMRLAIENDSHDNPDSLLSDI